MPTLYHIVILKSTAKCTTGAKKREKSAVFGILLSAGTAQLLIFYEITVIFFLNTLENSGDVWYTMMRRYGPGIGNDPFLEHVNNFKEKY